MITHADFDWRSSADRMASFSSQDLSFREKANSPESSDRTLSISGSISRHLYTIDWRRPSRHRAERRGRLAGN